MIHQFLNILIELIVILNVIIKILSERHVFIKTKIRDLKVNFIQVNADLNNCFEWVVQICGTISLLKFKLCTENVSKMMFGKDLLIILMLYFIVHGLKINFIVILKQTIHILFVMEQTFMMIQVHAIKHHIHVVQMMMYLICQIL